MTEPQTWLITGAARGLGRALAIAALDAGHTVVATVRGDHDLPRHDALVVETLDVRDREAVHDIVARTATGSGRIDVLVNNAGAGVVGAVEETSTDDVSAVLDANLLGPMWMAQAVVPVMRARGGGRIVQISTVGAVGTMPMLGLYNASKWGLEGWSEALAAEVAHDGIRVSIIEPGALDTDWAGNSMRFSPPSPANDGLRRSLFGTAEVPWPSTGEPAGGTSPEHAAAAIIEHVADSGDERLRVLVGSDAPAQVHAALEARLTDYRRDERFRAAEAQEPSTSSTR